MALQREGVLLLPGEIEVVGQVLGRVAHDEAAHRIGQAKLHADHRLEVARTEAQQSAEPLSPVFRPAKSQIQLGGLAIVEQRNAAHRFDAAGDDGARLAELDELGRRRQRLHAGCTVALHAMGDAIARNAGQQRDDAGDVGGIGRHGDVAEDDLIDLIGTQVRAFEHGGRGDAAQILSGHGSQRTVSLGEGRADAFENGDIEHEDSSLDAKI